MENKNQKPSNKWWYSGVASGVGLILLGIVFLIIAISMYSIVDQRALAVVLFLTGLGLSILGGWWLKLLLSGNIRIRR